MATANYQTPTKLTFFPSYLQYAYAAGLINDVYQNNGNDNSKEDLYSLLIVDPSNVTSLNLGSLESPFNVGFDIGEGDWNFDFGMFLGHRLLDYQSGYQTNYYGNQDNVEGGNGAEIPITGIVNSNNNVPSFNGWSAFNLSELPADQSIMGFKWELFGTDVALTRHDLGSFIIGKKWEAPQNIDISNNLTYNYGSKQSKSIGGKTLSKMNYYKTEKWAGLDAWELSEDVPEKPTQSRNGIRTWQCKWSFLQDKYAMPQNAMQNSNGWNQDSDSEYSTGADGSSLYNSSDGIDFHTSVIRLTMESHLPVVVRISESNNPDQWAVVRIKNYKISQNTPKFVNVSLTLEEQV